MLGRLWAHLGAVRGPGFGEQGLLGGCLAGAYSRELTLVFTTFYIPRRRRRPRLKKKIVTRTLCGVHLSRRAGRTAYGWYKSGTHDRALGVEFGRYAAASN